jgi:hypothetical protein
MLADQIYDCIKQESQLTDRQLASKLNISLMDVHAMIQQLTQEKRIYSCDIINFEDGHEVKGLLCRVSGYSPSGYHKKPK